MNKRIFAAAIFLTLVWVLVNAVYISKAQEPVEFSILVVNPTAGTYTIMATSSIYEGLNIDVVQDDLAVAADKFLTEATLPDYMALYGVFGFRLESTFEMRTVILFVFSRPITVPTTGGA